jgi:GH15 family glucan-1,4-alpha-glucosidase
LGIKPGYDIAHQTFGIIGLQGATSLAKIVNDKEKAILWQQTSEKMYKSYMAHKTHAMLADNKIIKRRLLDGSVQRELHVERKKENEDFFAKFLPKDMPLDKAGQHLLEPDTAQCFPIIYGIVDPKSDTARRTIDDLEKLWSQAWDGGGYGRYDISGEPDSPGPWALATCFMAQSYFEMGEHEKAMTAVDWLIEKAGSGGSWFEFYGERPTPPLPPTGILVWVWAQFITLVVKNMLGAEVENGILHVSPRIEGFKTALRFRDV